MDEATPQTLEEAMPQSFVAVVVQLCNVSHNLFCLCTWSSASCIVLEGCGTFWK